MIYDKVKRRRQFMFVIFSICLLILFIISFRVILFGWLWLSLSPVYLAPCEWERYLLLSPWFAIARELPKKSTKVYSTVHYVVEISFGLLKVKLTILQKCLIVILICKKRLWLAWCLTITCVGIKVVIVITRGEIETQIICQLSHQGIKST
jgi:hypothetical protein